MSSAELHADVLGVIFGFLNISLTALCQRVSRTWQSAVQRETPKQQRFVIYDAAYVLALELPLVQRHTAAVIIADDRRPSLWEAVPQLTQLLAGLPHVKRLEINGDSHLMLPQPNRALGLEACAALRELDLWEIAPTVPLCLAIKQLALTRLRWERRWQDDDGAFSFDIPLEIELPELEALCTLPHRLQALESFFICPSSSTQCETAPYTVTRRHLELLQQLGPKAVTSLTPSSGFTSDAFDLLPHFQHLETIDMYADGEDDVVQRAIDALVLLPMLRALLLRGMALPANALAGVAGVSSLRTLELRHCTCPDGLSALCNATSSQLTLNLEHCDDITFAHLQQLRECHALRVLTIELACDEDDLPSERPAGWLTDDQQRVLKVPSQLLPSLKQFRFMGDIRRSNDYYSDDGYRSY